MTAKRLGIPALGKRLLQTPSPLRARGTADDPKRGALPSKDDHHSSAAQTSFACCTTGDQQQPVSSSILKTFLSFLNIYSMNPRGIHTVNKRSAAFPAVLGVPLGGP